MNWLKSIGEAFYNAWVPEKRYLAYLSGLRMTLLISLFAVILGILIGIRGYHQDIRKVRW